MVPRPSTKGKTEDAALLSNVKHEMLPPAFHQGKDSRASVVEECQEHEMVPRLSTKGKTEEASLLRNTAKAFGPIVSAIERPELSW